MNEYLVYIAIFVGVLLVCLVIPGVKVIAEAILKLSIELGGGLLKNKSNFVIWYIKTLLSDHVAIVRHATQSRDTIDPTQHVRRHAEGYED